MIPIDVMSEIVARTATLPKINRIFISDLLFANFFTQLKITMKNKA